MVRRSDGSERTTAAGVWGFRKNLPSSWDAHCFDGRSGGLKPRGLSAYHARRRRSAHLLSWAATLLLLVSFPVTSADDVLTCTSSGLLSSSATAGRLFADGNALVGRIQNCTFVVGAPGAVTRVWDVSFDLDPQNGVYLFDAPWADPSRLVARFAGFLGTAPALFNTSSPTSGVFTSGSFVSTSGFATLVFWTGARTPHALRLSCLVRKKRPATVPSPVPPAAPQITTASGELVSVPAGSSPRGPSPSPPRQPWARSRRPRAPPPSPTSPRSPPPSATRRLRRSLSPQG